jgi:hypothetical protein
VLPKGAKGRILLCLPHLPGMLNALLSDLSLLDFLTLFFLGVSIIEAVS